MTAVDAAAGSPAGADRAGSGAASLGARRHARTLGHLLRYDVLILVRNRQARLFTLGLPVMMLFLFASIFGNDTVAVAGHHLRTSTYYVANQLAFGVVGAAFSAVAVAVVTGRETGLLKRRRATPEPAWMLIASRCATGAVSALGLSAVLLAAGWAAFGAGVSLAALPALAGAVAVGTAAFCALGFAASGLIRNAEAAQPVVTFLSLPLFFASGVFIPWPLLPRWLRIAADAFPVRHLAVALTQPFLGGASPFAGGQLLWVVAWGVAGLGVAAATFSWSPKG